MRERVFLWKQSTSQEIKNKAFRHCFSMFKTSPINVFAGWHWSGVRLLFVVPFREMIGHVYQFLSHPGKPSLEFMVICTEVKRTRLCLTSSQLSQRTWQNKLKSQEKNILGFEISSRVSSQVWALLLARWFPGFIGHGFHKTKMQLIIG